MKRTFAYVIIVIGFILVTFFGLGPVMFADGSSGERIITLIVVLMLYAVLAVLFRFVRKHRKL